MTIEDLKDKYMGRHGDIPPNVHPPDFKDEFCISRITSNTILKRAIEESAREGFEVGMSSIINSLKKDTIISANKSGETRKQFFGE